MANGNGNSNGREQRHLNHYELVYLGFAWVMLACLFVNICVTLVWQLYPYKVMTVKSITVLGNVVSGKGYLEYSLDYCKNLEYAGMVGVVQHSFIDGVKYDVPESTSLIEAGCHVITVWLPMPSLPPGEYQLQMRSEYKVNRVRTIEIKMMSAPFLIYSNETDVPEAVVR